MSLAEVRSLEDRYLMRTYRRGAVDFVRGEGSLLWDADGKEYKLTLRKQTELSKIKE